MKVDVAIQSYKKPESLVYTLLSLKKYCGNHIDTIYINDDCSGDGVIEHYKKPELLKLMSPIKIKVRVNTKPSGYTHTIVTKEVLFRKGFVEKMKLLGHFFINRAKWYSTTDDIRYQWAINQTNQKYIFLIHDDIKFYGDVLKLYLDCFEEDENLAIVGDLGGSKRCPYGPCGSKCKPKNILDKKYPSNEWPITGKHSLLHTLLGRYKRNCRINEWCCLIDVEKCRKIQEDGTFFGNYEGGGDVGCMWFAKIIDKGYSFFDPLPTAAERQNYYLHWWQGYEGHDVWVNRGNGKADYEKEMIINCISKEYGYNFLER